MADNVNLEVKGLQDLKKLMQNYPDAINNKILKSAQRKALKPLVKAAKAKTTSKFIADNIRIRAVRGETATEAGFIYKKSTNKNKAKTPWYARFVEFGTTTRRPKKGKYLVFQGDDGNMVFAEQVRGIPAKPFWRPSKDKEWQSGKKPTKEMKFFIAKSLESYQRRYIKKFS